MKITALTENTTQCGLPTEHGLSLYIETEKHTVLFDMGQSDLFAQNAASLGVDLRKADAAVLSHGHYDHGGGLKTFLEINDHAPVYMSRYAFEPHYNGEEKYIGIDPDLEGNQRIILTEGVTKIADKLTLFSCNGREKLFDPGSGGLTVKQNGTLTPDDFRHEQYLLIEERGKRVLVSGCSHKGILNLAAWFKPDVLVGGFHLMNQPLDDRLKALAEQLNRCRTDYYTCHCTGAAQYAFLKPYMNRLHYLAAGDTIEV